LARLALAVHSIDPVAFRTYDAWLFEESGSGGWYPRGIADARMYAASLVGAERLEDALASSAVDLAIARAADLFGRTSSQGHGGIPRFVTAGRWLVPEASDAASLVSLLSSELGIR
jgi:hypothetical protein